MYLNFKTLNLSINSADLHPHLALSITNSHLVTLQRGTAVRLWCAPLHVNGVRSYRSDFKGSGGWAGHAGVRLQVDEVCLAGFAGAYLIFC